LNSLRVETTDYHTAGEPFRIVRGDAARLEGRTILEKRRFAESNLDHIRQLLVNEPRGHADMYGGFVTEPEDDKADLGVVFFHNAGYSTACGHGTIALVTWALESGYLEAAGREREVVVDVPSGRLKTVAQLKEGKVTSVRFRNVPSFVLKKNLEVPTDLGIAAVDIAFGGAFYASLEAPSLALRVRAADLPTLIEIGRALKHAVQERLEVVHPLEPELRDIYGVIFFEPATGAGDLRQRNVTVFADGEVDRSPTGSGMSARLALLDEAGELPRGKRYVLESIVGTEFEGTVVGATQVLDLRAVITEVEGSAYETGTHNFILDPRDPLGTGFLLR
jgi:proline racemase